MYCYIFCFFFVKARPNRREKRSSRPRTEKAPERRRAVPTTRPPPSQVPHKLDGGYLTAKASLNS